MRALKEWPGTWIAAAWVLWPVLLVILGALALAFIVGTAEHAADAVGVSFSAVHVEPGGVPLLLAVTFGPPLLLTGAWLGWRGFSRKQPPA
jgi:hypothetical protein